MPIEALYSIRTWNGENVHQLRQWIDLTRTSGYPFLRDELRSVLLDLAQAAGQAATGSVQAAIEALEASDELLSLRDTKGRQLIIDSATLSARVIDPEVSIIRSKVIFNPSNKV